MGKIFLELSANIYIVLIGCLIIYFLFKKDMKLTRRFLNINFGGLFPVLAYMAFIIVAYTLNFSNILLRSMILFLVIFAMIFYVLLIVRDIRNESMGIVQTMLKIGINAAYLCIFFSFVYFSIYIFGGQESFSGNIGDNLLEQFISFFYFSFISFNTIGYGDIIPQDSFTRIIVVIQTIMYFIITLYAFSSISIIRERLAEKNNRPTEDNASSTETNKISQE